MARLPGVSVADLSSVTMRMNYQKKDSGNHYFFRERRVSPLPERKGTFEEIAIAWKKHTGGGLPVEKLLAPPLHPLLPSPR